MAGQLNRRYLLGEFVLEPETRQLSRAGRSAHLPNLPFQVLLYLVENRARMVERGELLEHFWKDKEVTDDALRKAIGAIRRALGDHSDAPRFIETRWSGGYRYVGPCEESFVTRWAPEHEDERARERTDGAQTVALSDTISEKTFTIEAHAASVPPARSRHAIFLALMLTLVVFVMAGAGLYFNRPRAVLTRPPTLSRSVAVLPLKNLTNDPVNDYFSDGLTESLITSLSKIEGLKVISSGSVFTYKGKQADPREVGRRLGVAAVVEGGVQQNGGRVRIAIRLVNAEDGRVLWGDDYFERSEGDLFALQDEVARHVVNGLSLSLSGDDARKLARRYTENVEAYQSYLRGRFFLNQRNAASLKRASEYFRRAIDLDGRYALAYAGLAECHVMLLWFTNAEPREAMRQAREAALKAIELDDTLAEAHLALARAYGNDWDWQNSRREFERALALNPHSAEIFHAYAYDLIVTGHADEAIAAIRRAQELDPLSITINVDVGEILLCAGRYDEAIQALRQALELDPERWNAHFDLSQAYEAKGMHREAVAAYLKSEALRGEGAETLAESEQAFATAGIHGFWRKRAELAEREARTSYVSPYVLARLYVRAGDRRRALALLEQVSAERSPHILNLRLDPMLNDLRSEPEIKALLRRAGLPE
jgi:TolB-like protein/DNA-binding winged helix-turn-helix (wHTH) protein/Flp pilus assembly protein TadD